MRRVTVVGIVVYVGVAVGDTCCIYVVYRVAFVVVVDGRLLLT